MGRGCAGVARGNLQGVIRTIWKVQAPPRTNLPTTINQHHQPPVNHVKGEGKGKGRGKAEGGAGRASKWQARGRGVKEGKKVRGWGSRQPEHPPQNSKSVAQSTLHQPPTYPPGKVGQEVVAGGRQGGTGVGVAGAGWGGRRADKARARAGKGAAQGKGGVGRCNSGRAGACRCGGRLVVKGSRGARAKGGEGAEAKRGVCAAEGGMSTQPTNCNRPTEPTNNVKGRRKARRAWKRWG